MSNTDIVLTERCGTLGRVMIIRKHQESNKVVRLSAADTLAKSLIHRAQDLFREVFLPHGYPDSVSEDYLEYQVWDTVQAFCSTITGTFTTQAILKSVGVGDAKATPFAAAITWIMKDGTGMIGRIVFAWWKGNSLDADCKKWRLCADILNDAAMFLELLVSYVGKYSIQVLCLTTAMKAIVGVAGGATRASITQHQAVKGNMADVSAKDGSQETFVNLVASFVGVILLAIVSQGHYEWGIFLVFTVIHLIANYFAVCSLHIPYLNNSRLMLVLRTYLRFDSVPNPFHVNRKESVIIGFGPDVRDICGYNIEIGNSLNNVSGLTAFDLTTLINSYKDSKYLLIPNIKKRVISIALENGESSQDAIGAYFHAVLLGIALCYYNQIPVNVHSKRQLHHVTPVVRLYSALKDHQKTVITKEEQLSLHALKAFNEFITQEVPMFFTALHVNGWDVDRHSLEIGEWRANWKGTDAAVQKNIGHSKVE